MSDHGDESHLSCDSQVLHGIGPIDWVADITPAPAPEERGSPVPVLVQRVEEGDPDGDGTGFAGPVAIPLDLLGHMLVAPAVVLAAVEQELADAPHPPPAPPAPPVVGAGNPAAGAPSVPRAGTMPVPKAGDARSGVDAVEVSRLEREVAALRQTTAGLQRQLQEALSGVSGLRSVVEAVQDENRGLRSRLKKIEREFPREIENIDKRERRRAEQETVGADLTDRRLQLIEYHLKRINEVLQLGPLDHPEAVTVRDLVRHLSRVYADLKTGKKPAVTGAKP